MTHHGSTDSRQSSVKSPKHGADAPATSPAYGDGMSTAPALGTHVVVVGAGMVAHRFVESLLSRAGDQWRVTLIGEEGRHPYDRVGLTGFFGGASPDDLTLERSVLEDERVRFLRGDAVSRIDRSARRVTTRSGVSVAYDRRVLATGSYAARLAGDGVGLEGCFV